MSELTLSEIEQLLTEGTVPYWSEYYKKWYDMELGWDMWAWENSLEGTRVEGLGQVTTVEQFGGEGQGDQAWVVIKIKFDDGTEKYYRKDGYHASHDGTYFDGDFDEVTPQQKVVTVYE